jgi:Multicopper oxidase
MPFSHANAALHIGARSEAMMIDRRSFLKYAGLVSIIGAATRLALADEVAAEKADYTLRIGTGLVELAPDHIVSTALYNGQFPGPLLRFKEGQQVIVDIYNDTDTPELVHWHGQMIPSDVDGASEEGSPFVPAHRRRRISFVPKPFRLSILPYACRGRGRPEPRHVHGSGRAGLHRTEDQPRRL